MDDWVEEKRRTASVCNHILPSITEYKDQEKKQKSTRNTPVTGNVEFATSCEVQAGKKPVFALPSAQRTIFQTQKSSDMIKWKFWKHYQLQESTCQLKKIF